MPTQYKKPIIAGQLSTVHSPEKNLQVAWVDRYLDSIIREVPLDILILGWNEKRELFDHLTNPGSRKSDQVFLWYPFLSDYPEMVQNHLVKNLNGETSTGWRGYEGTGINESFQQACPNNPMAISTSLKHLERLLNEYNFDGVFIDKIRYPSPANGFDEIFSCFCDHCKVKADQYDLDLWEVKYILRNVQALKALKPEHSISNDKTWLDGLLANQPVLQQFINFRMSSINRVLTEINNLLKKTNKKLALDVFSPSLAPLVGQDYGFMSTIAEWVKPMIYQFGHGPSSLRSEIPALIYGIRDYLGFDISEISKYVSSTINGLKNVSIDEIANIAPLSIIHSETELAVKKLAGTQVYLGLETVYIPHKMEIQPEDIEEILKIGSNLNVNGFVLSWDLLHTPVINVIPLKALT